MNKHTIYRLHGRFCTRRAYHQAHKWIWWQKAKEANDPEDRYYRLYCLDLASFCHNVALGRIP